MALRGTSFATAVPADMPDDSPSSQQKRIFLLSPAYCGGRRASWFFREPPGFELAQRLQQGEEVSIGEVFSFLSGLYFRGKLTYARRFAADESRVLVITPNQGLREAQSHITLDELRGYAEIDVSLDDPRYREPLEHDVRELASRCGEYSEVVLLGSIATGKYVEVLSAHLGNKLQFPTDFIGRGDMSRGGLLLRAAESGKELEYSPVVLGEKRCGKRPPKLPPRAP